MLSPSRQAINLHLLAHNGAISYGEMESISDEHNVKNVSSNRYLQNSKSAGREWGFRKYDIAGNILKPGKPWVLRKMTVKAFAKFKREMKKVIFKK